MPASEPGIPKAAQAPTRNECRRTEQFYKSLDPEIAPVVRLLHQHEVFTLESCQGGPGHAYGYPTVLFHRNQDTASAVRKLARDHGLRPIRVSRKRPLFYSMKPYWTLTLHHPPHRKLSIKQRIWCMAKFAIGL